MKYITWKIVRKVTDDVFASSDVSGDNELSYRLRKTTATGNFTPIFVYFDKDTAQYNYGFYTPSLNEEYFLLEGYSTQRPIRINTLTERLYWPSMDMAKMTRAEIIDFWKACQVGSPPLIPDWQNTLIVHPDMWGVPNFTPERIVDIREEW